MIHHLDHEALAAMLAPIGGVDAVVVDAPYSARTHGAHDTGTADLPDGAERRPALASASRGMAQRAELEALAPVVVLPVGSARVAYVALGCAPVGSGDGGMY